MVYSLAGTAHGTYATLKIGVVLPFSGPMEPYGNQMLSGMKLALVDYKQIDPKITEKVKLFYGDDKGLTSEVTSQAKKLIQNNKVHVLLGSVSNTLSLELAKMASDYRKPMVSPIAEDSLITGKSEYVFSSALSTGSQGAVLATFAKRSLRKSRAVVVINEESGFEKTLSDAFQETFRAKGGTILTTISYNDETALETTLSDIPRLRPDIIFFPAPYQRARQFLYLASKGGIKTPVLGSNAWNSPNFLNSGDSYINGNYFFTQFAEDDPSPKVRTFSRKFQTAFKSPPTVHAALGYDAMSMILHAFTKADSVRITRILQYRAVTMACSASLKHKRVQCLINKIGKTL